MTNQSAQVDWKDGVLPVSRRFDDPYYSIHDGLAETQYVFLAGNGLPERFHKGFHIAELGFGAGLNLLAAWRAWMESGQPGTLRYTSFEAFPMTPGDMARALAAFPDLSGYANELLSEWVPRSKMLFAGLEFSLIIGDARETLAKWDGAADAWFLDGFAPAKNPELWEADLMREVARHTRVGGSLATYTAAGKVRRDLAAAGFAVARKSGFGHKRHMTTAQLVSP